MPSASSPLPEWGDMQGLILSSYPAMDRAAYLLCRFERSVSHATAWLANTIDKITVAVKTSNARNPVNVNIALSYSGLSKLCPQVATATGLDYAFVEGVAGTGHRSRILGDTGRSAPDGWDWGVPGDERRRVDLLLMVFAPDRDTLSKAIENLELAHSGITVFKTLCACSLKEMKGREHFGFRDGISQPILRGSPDAERYPHSGHVTALGEFVFGYPDAFGYVASGPRLPIGKGSGRQPVDLGRNGTYLVFRQLSQDVQGFWGFFEKAARCHGAESAERLAAKVVGRELDGTPLVPYLNGEDNEFGFAADPLGYGCPIGAHIRRSNPRDSLGKDEPSQPPNRHRVLRRGRSYGDPPKDRGPLERDGKDRGLLFLCLNTDLERQFEFIHQNWINDPGFAGLAEERDPLVGDRAAGGGFTRFTIPGVAGPARLDRIPPFITVKGGEYFFLPGIAALRFLAGVA